MKILEYKEYILNTKKLGDFEKRARVTERDLDDKTAEADYKNTAELWSQRVNHYNSDDVRFCDEITDYGRVTSLKVRVNKNLWFCRTLTMFFDC